MTDAPSVSLTVHELMPLLRAASPACAEVCDARAAGDEELLYVQLGTFASHLVEQLAVGEVADTAVVATLVERLLGEGDTTVQEAVAIGLLEGIQNRALQSGLDLPRIRAMFGPAARTEWDALVSFWGDAAG